MYNNEKDKWKDCDGGFFIMKEDGFTLPEVAQVVKDMFPFGVPDESAPVSTKKLAEACYNKVKNAYPTKNVLKENVDLEKIVKENSFSTWNDMTLLKVDFHDVEGVLDFLYGHSLLVPAKAPILRKIIYKIEALCTNE